MQDHAMSPVKRLVDVLLAAKRRRRIEDLAEEVAGKCRFAVSQSSAGAEDGVSLSQLRGYVMAMAARPVGIEVTALGRRQPLDREMVEAVAREATEQLIYLIVRERPTCHMPLLRRAA
jgi:hypothetical protein